jgi:hypothetical protein
MHYAPKVVLNCRDGYRVELDAIVEQFLVDGVRFVAVAGSDCSRVEDIIDELVVGDGADESRFILTSSHPGEPLGDVIEFVRTSISEPAGEPQVVEL